MGKGEREGGRGLRGREGGREGGEDGLCEVSAHLKSFMSSL